MGGHVVGAFASVAMREIFGSDRGERGLEIERHIRVGVFVDRQRGRGMLQEQMQQADTQVGEFGQGVDDLAGDEMKTAWAGSELECALVPRHSGYVW